MKLELLENFRSRRGNEAELSQEGRLPTKGSRIFSKAAEDFSPLAL